jgi:SAM-dependent methyltransferase
MDMGDNYPSATITGVDLSPTQSEWVPPNVYFEVDDIEEPWTYNRKFDYIHQRFMVGSIRDWPNLMKQCFDNLKPGGWVELCDWDYEPHRPDGTIDKRDNWIVKWHSLVIDTCAEKIGVHPNPPPEFKAWATAAGFEDVREVVFQVPVGGWAKNPKLKEIGRYYRYSLEEGLDSITLRIFTQLLGYTLTEAKATNAMFRNAIKENNFYHQM